jgi:GGDEF domain-containing protein
MFRYSGDEFVLFLEIDSAEALKKLHNLCIEAKDKLDITISAGVTDVDLSVSIKTNYYRAVQACYAIKEAGGDGVEKR